MSWLLKYLGNEVQGREDKYFINMCRWIYGLACHSSPVVFSSAHDRGCLLPTENHTFSFSGLCTASNIGVCSFWNPSWVVLLPQKLTQPGRKSKYLISSTGIHRWWLEKWGSFLKVPKFQGEEAAASRKLFCVTSTLSLPGKSESCSSAGRGRGVGTLPGWVLSLIFPFPIKKRT